MLIDIAGLVRVRFDVEDSPIQQYIKEEYGHMIVEDDAVDADIIFKTAGELRRNDHDVYFRAPVAYDDEGVFWYDQTGRMARVDLQNFDIKPTHVQMDNEFDNHFLGVIMEYLVNFKLISHGACLFHASAIDYEGTRVLFPAWRHTGKTNLMLHFLQHGGSYIADDWVILFRDGTALPLPKRLHLLYYNFVAYPDLMDGLDPQSRALIQFTKQAMRGEYDLDLDVIDAVRQKIRFRRPINELAATSGNFQKVPVAMVMLLQKCIRDEQSVMAQDRVARVMVNLTEPMLWFEQMHFHTAYAAHKLWSGQQVPCLERSREVISEILFSAFENIPFLQELSFTENLDVEKIAEQVKSAMKKRNLAFEKSCADTSST